MKEQIPPLPTPAQNKEDVYDYEQLAKMQEVFLEQARKNPDIKLIDLDESMKGMGGEKEKGVIERVTLDFKEIRQKIQTLKEDLQGLETDAQFKKVGQDERGDIFDGKILFERLAGGLEEGKVTMQFTPFGVYLKCDKPTDFGSLYSETGLKAEADSSLNERLEKVENAKKIAMGIATHFEYAYSGIDVPLIAENTELLKKDINGNAKTEDRVIKERSALYAHEQQHIINGLFANILFLDDKNIDSQLLEASEKIKEFKGAVPDKDKKFGGAKENIAGYIDKLKKHFLRNAQNEIIAYFKEGVAIENIQKLLTEKNSLYDYFGQFKPKLRTYFKDLFKEDAEELWAFAEKRFEEQYLVDIIKAITLCFLLLTRFPREKIVNLFNLAPIGDWEKHTDRLMSSES